MAPADVDSVLTVGATYYDKKYAPFSSVGPNSAGQQKPDVAAVGYLTIIGAINGTPNTSSGTSFSAPQVAGLCALLWQGHPNLTSQEIVSVVKKSGTQADSPDNFLGYGVPNGLEAEKIIDRDYKPLGLEQDLENVAVFPNPVTDKVFLSFPKSFFGKMARVKIIYYNGMCFDDFNIPLTDIVEIDTNTLFAGLYIVNVVINDNPLNFRFIKM